MKRMIPFESETELAKRLHSVYRKYAGNMGAGDHLPETWNAVAIAARESDPIVRAASALMDSLQHAYEANPEAFLEFSQEIGGEEFQLACANLKSAFAAEGAS